MNICVVGAGAIGGWVAAKLALAGKEVSVLARGDTLRLVHAEGLRLEENGEEFVASVESSNDCAALGPQDVLFVAVKAPALPPLASEIRPLIGSQTTIVPMLNGVPWWFVEGMQLKSVDPQGSIAAALPFEQVIGCVVHASCHRSAPNRIHVKHAEKLIIGEPGGAETSKRLGRLFALLDEAGLKPDVTGNVRRAIWYKLWGNATINPLSALTRATCDHILADAECRAWMLEGMAELAAIGALVGCPISESGEDRMAVTARLGAFKTSMLQDVEAGRPIELEALVGAPREIARARGIATPALDRLYGVTKLMAETLGLG
ncbi:ketopantoate reductase family protein [Sphingomonas sp.]|uniref:ketopantoate reductase family protein n=1 Tax=Sphingomonas sp. TaxID=28214 RepID=UPI0038AF3C34